MSAFMHPADLSPAERFSEITTLLARGFLRLRSRGICVGSLALSAVNGEEILEPVANPRLHGAQKERIP